MLCLGSCYVMTTKIKMSVFLLRSFLQHIYKVLQSFGCLLVDKRTIFLFSGPNIFNFLTPEKSEQTLSKFVFVGNDCGRNILYVFQEKTGATISTDLLIRSIQHENSKGSILYCLTHFGNEMAAPDKTALQFRASFLTCSLRLWDSG